MLVIPACRAAEKTLYVLVMLLLKVAALVVSPGGWYRGQVHERVDALIAIVDSGQSLNGLPIVGQVDPHEVTMLRCRGHPIEGDDIPTVFQQVGNTRPAKFSAAPGYCDLRHCATPHSVPT